MILLPIQLYVKLIMQYLVSNTLCSSNFQNVKLWLDFVGIWEFYRHSDFTWNQILAYSNMSILVILEVLNFDF